MKAPRSTWELPLKLASLRVSEEGGITGVEVKFIDISRNIHGEGSFLDISDTERRQRGEQTGLDTLVVHAVNDAYSLSGSLQNSVA